MVECKRERNIERCNCTYPCGKKGMCCDCLQSHLRNGEFPACFFPNDIEKSYDRSIDTFIRVYQERGAWW
jgi:hypothetical protein